MKHLRLVSLALLTPLILLASCKSLGQLGDALSPYTPKLKFNQLALKGLDFTKIEVEFIFDLHNPNPLAVKLDTFSYDLGLEGVQVVKGTNNEGIQLKSYGDTQLAIPVSLTFANLFELVKNVQGKDDLGFSIGGELGFKTPVGMARVPFKEEGRFPVVHAPSISLEGLRMGKVDLLKQTASLQLDLGVGNPGSGKAVSFAGFEYGLAMGGAKVASGTKNDIPEVAGGKKQVISLPIDIDLKSAAKTLVGAITGKKAIDVKLDGKVQVGTPFGKIPLTFDQLGSLIPH